MVLLLILAMPSLAEVSIVGGRYYVHNGETQIGNYYNIDTTAKEAAVNESLRCKCEVIITQPSIRVNFIEDKVSGTISIEATWDAPSLREDGSALLPEEILGYEIGIDGGSNILLASNILLHTFTDLENVTHMLRLRTVADNGYSAYVTLETNRL